MNKNAIQKYAIWARNELIEQVKQRAYQYGISDKGYGDENATVISGRVLSTDEKRQRTAFVHEIQKHGYQEAVEEVAYTWFNRFVALRFMEVNDYLPTHVRVFSDASGGFNPEILKDVLHLDLDGLDKAKVSELLNANKTEELYRYLLLTQCNALNAALPEMFEKLGSYTEMLLPNNILKQDSILARLVKDIDEEDWKDAVQIIGWMYQYYNTEPKAAVFARPSTVKIKREEIPAATQLFTPDWVVRYMVENSLGRLWLESHPNPTLKANWKYYLDEAEQTTEVAEQLRVLRSQSPVKSPEDIRLIDPCMGSGHILVYAFDVLVHIYESVGVSPRDAAKLILEKNIFGLDIDRRAYQLAYFALMMKARQYNRRILTLGVRPQVYEPTGYADGLEFGSLVRVEELESMPEPPNEQQLTIFDGGYDTKLNTWHFRRLLAQKYEVVVTNPPYMGSSGLSAKLSEFVKNNYPDSKSDMFAVFIERCEELLKPTGYNAMITQPSLVALSSYEKLRKNIIKNNTITSMIHMGRGIFGIDFGSVAFVINKKFVKDYLGTYFRLYERTFQYIAPEDICSIYLNAISTSDYKYDFASYDTAKPISIDGRSSMYGKRVRFVTNQDSFQKIPNTPLAYWVNRRALQIFTNKPISSIAKPVEGIKTGDNDQFLRYWFEIEVNKSSVFLPIKNAKWVKCSKGGPYRRWYGNLEYVIDWEHNGVRLRNFKGATISNEALFFTDAITWSYISAGKISMRYVGADLLFNNKGPACFVNKDNLLYLLALANSNSFQWILNLWAQTMDYKPGNISVFPFIRTNDVSAIEEMSKHNIEISRKDWDAFETSWEFTHHPLLNGERTVTAAFGKWKREATERFDTLKANEEELNRIFIDIYSLQDELTPEVEDKDVTVRCADLGREIRSLISYAVGCMFGRYSLDAEGLAYAGGEWDNSKYITFIPDKDNILPICDDEYFDDDILGRFVDFVRVVYGQETLEENLKFIADALGGKGTPREVIRNYFLNDFYADHCKIYQKRPIYWLFDSGKKNGFKSLVYLHRYQSDLLAKLRTDYVHEQQERYRTQLSHLAVALNTATGSERARLLKQQDKLSEQLKEITAFEEKVHHLADQNIEIDLDDGIKKNYEIFTDVLAKI